MRSLHQVYKTSSYWGGRVCLCAFYRVIESHAIHFIYQRINYTKIRKNILLIVRNVHSVRWSTHSLFSSCFMHIGGVYCFMETVQQTRHSRFVWHGRIGNPQTNSGKLSKNVISDSIRQWTLFVPVKKTSLHFGCWKTTDGLRPAGYNTTWLAWTVVRSQRYYVFISRIELYWIAINKYFNMGCMIFHSPWTSKLLGCFLLILVSTVYIDASV
jgi:hypothetical protein